MSVTIGINQAKELLEKGRAQAEQLISDPSKIDELLVQFENRLKEVALVGETVSKIPLMVAMIKGYITGTYQDVSPKVIATLVGAVIYLVKKEDLISDELPFIGLADDLGVITAALKFCEPELQAFAGWRDGSLAESEPGETKKQPEEETGALGQVLRRKPVLLDGAVGTSLWAKAEERGYKKDPVWIYNIEHPDIVEELAKEYADAGSKIILSNTFGANRLAVARSSSYTVPQVVKAAVEITKKALEGTGCKTALSAGPLSVLLEPYGDLEEEECREIYEEMIQAGMEAGAEVIMLQTFYDLAMMKIAACAAVKYDVPVYCTMTFEKSGRTMMGNSVDDVIRELEPLGISGIGMNCSLGPEMALPIIREFAEKTSLPLVFKPNAGLPISTGGTAESAIDAETFAKALEPAFDLVSYIGGCCGSDPSYIREIGALLEKHFA